MYGSEYATYSLCVELYLRSSLLKLNSPLTAVGIVHIFTNGSSITHSSEKLYFSLRAFSSNYPLQKSLCIVLNEIKYLQKYSEHRYSPSQ